MASASQAVIRSQGMSGIGAKHVLNNNSPHYPLDPVVTSAHLVEHLELKPLTGAIAPGVTAEFEMSLEADILKKLTLEVFVPAIVNNAATQSAYVNWFGLAIWEEIEFKFATERLQTLRPEELFIHIHKKMDDEERLMAQKLLGFDTLANRVAAAARPQVFHIPLYTLLGLSIGSDASQSLFVRGLGERLKLKIKFRPFDKWIEANGTITSPTTDTVVLADSNLLAEYEHVYDDERAQLEEIYSMPRRYVFSEQQYYSFRIPATQTLGTTLSFTLRNFDQPAYIAAILFRWAADLDRVNLLADPGLVEPTFGFRLFNVDDWYNQGSPIITHVAVKVGSNNYLLKRTPVQRLISYEHHRSFKGSADIAMPTWTYSHDPSRPNAVLGFVDPSQMDQPTLELTTSTSTGPWATVGAAATALLGASSDLDVMVVLFTHNQLNFDKHQVRHPFN